MHYVCVCVCDSILPHGPEPPAEGNSDPGPQESIYTHQQHDTTIQVKRHMSKMCRIIKRTNNNKCVGHSSDSPSGLRCVLDSAYRNQLKALMSCIIKNKLRYIRMSFAQGSVPTPGPVCALSCCSCRDQGKTQQERTIPSRVLRHPAFGSRSY